MFMHELLRHFLLLASNMTSLITRVRCSLPRENTWWWIAVKFLMKAFFSCCLPFSSPLLSPSLSEDQVWEQQHPQLFDKVLSQRNSSREWTIPASSLVLATLGLRENNWNKPKEELILNRMLNENEIPPLDYLTREMVVCPMNMHFRSREGRCDQKEPLNY